MSAVHLAVWLAVAAARTAAPAAPTDDSLYQLTVPLEDQDGHAARLDRFRGHPVLVTMFYGSCPQACPLLISKMKLLEKKLTPAERAELRVLLVSLDPARDTPPALKSLARLHGVDEGRWMFARTSGDHVRDLAAVLGIKFHPLNNGAIYHSSIIVLLDGQGRMVGRSEGLELEVDGLLGQLRRCAPVPEATSLKECRAGAGRCSAGRRRARARG